jgi:Spy/CpxP family protein refolding chaperone
MSTNGWKNSWLVAGALLSSVFASGALSALAIDRLLERDEPPRSVSSRRGEPGDFGRPAMSGRGRGGPGSLGLSPVLLDQLLLTDSQRDAVLETLERRRQHSDALLDGLRPQLRAQLDSARSEVRALLTPEQQQTFDRLLEEERSRFLRRHSRD